MDGADAVSITIDVDWVPTRVLEDTVALLDDHDIEATVFSTHDDGLTLDTHERAVHPNFGTDDSPTEVLDELASLYPGAIGLRSHTLEVSTRLRSTYADRMLYESQYMTFGREGIEPFWMQGEVVQFPVYFMDDVWLRFGAERFDPTAEASKDGLRIYCFHPIHVFLNTPSIEYYTEHKDDYHDADQLEANRFDGYGIRDVFVALLDALSREPVDVRRLDSLAASFVDSRPYEDAGRL